MKRPRGTRVTPDVYNTSYRMFEIPNFTAAAGKRSGGLTNEPGLW